MHLLLLISLITISISAGICGNDLSLSYKIQLININKSGNASSSSDTINTQEIQLFFEDSIFYVTKGNQRTAYDFIKEKIYFLHIPTRTYDETALYSEIDYRRLEFSKRLNLKTLLGNNGESKIGSLFDLETLFGIEIQKDSLTSYITQVKDSSAIQFYHQNKLVVNTHFSEEKLNRHLSIFHKFLLYETQMHPHIIGEIVEVNLIPSEFTFIFNNGGKTFKVQYTLQNVKKNTSVSELNNSYFLYGYQTKDELLTSINKVYGFVHHESVKLPDFDDCIESFNEAMRRKEYIDAFLMIMECKLCKDYNFSAQFDQLKQQARQDKKFNQFLHAVRQSDTTSHIQDKIQFLETLNTRKKLSKNYMIDAFLANYYSIIHKKEKSLQLLFNVVNHNPYITSIYSDLGDLFTEQNNLRMAWKCYEIAIRLNNDHPLAKKLIFKKVYLKNTFEEYFF